MYRPYRRVCSALRGLVGSGGFGGGCCGCRPVLGGVSSVGGGGVVGCREYGSGWCRPSWGWCRRVGGRRCCVPVPDVWGWGLVVNGEEAPPWWGLLPVMVVRRCPTLPHSLGCSTIGAVGLSFRVRNGTGRFPHAMTAVTLSPCCGPGQCSRGASRVACYTIIHLLPQCAARRAAVVGGGLLGVNRIVDAHINWSPPPGGWVCV